MPEDQTPPPCRPPQVAGADTGGTFTDVVFLGPQGLALRKVLSTPRDPGRAVLEALKALGLDRDTAVVHGSTVATNAILERKGARTALVTNQGFEDLIEIGRQNRLRLYDLAYSRPEPLIPAGLRFGVRGRITSQGTEHEPLDPNQAEEAARAVAESGAESVAVCLLFSFLNPSHELALGRALAGLDLPVSLSHEILAEFREYERTSTTVVNAYVGPKMTGYLKGLKAALPGGLRVMQSNGGVISADTAMAEPVRTILSGPAGGAVAALEAARAAGFERIISLDMGGTSTDVCLADKGLPLALEASIAGLAVKTPMIDIQTVGAGGGSLAWIDAGGALRVGPESAGADPGPICYGKGERVTVTDADLFLGRLDPERFLGGAMPLHGERVEPAMRALAEQAGLSALDLAQGVLAVVNSNMERAIRVVSVERGLDPAEFSLVAFGGAGGMHCADLARSMSMPRALVPRNPGLLSALGMILADVVKDFSRTVMLRAEDLGPEDLDRLFRPLEERAARDMAGQGARAGQVFLERSLDMRYQGQSFELTTPAPPGADLREAFEALHERAYGHRNPDAAVEAVNLRLRARAATKGPGFAKIEPGGRQVPKAALLRTRKAVFQGRALETRVLDRDRLLAGNCFQGPALVVEYSSTVVVPPGASVLVDGFGNLILKIDG
ncbi:MAG: hydantoinase/oxoprolinase family protein [Desulfovibrionaceae bacterium]|nr:hydantoinase/oxoprolinase family protein [Desulfovibrionaceae bacterium]